MLMFSNGLFSPLHISAAAAEKYAHLLGLVGAHRAQGVRGDLPSGPEAVLLPTPQGLLASGLYEALSVRPDYEQAAFVQEDPVALAHGLELLGVHAGVQSALDRLRNSIDCRDERARMIRRVQRRLVVSSDEDAV
ncbi:MAG: hypothetical protein AAGA29_10495 [Planctomycetota bacterium]